VVRPVPKRRDDRIGTPPTLGIRPLGRELALSPSDSPFEPGARSLRGGTDHPMFAAL
jgi:hypothetical protein